MEKKRTVVHWVICMGLVCIVWGGYFLVKHFGADRILDINDDDFSWVYQVDSVESKNEEFVLRGFAFELKKDTAEGAFEIVLQNVETGKKFFSKMKYTNRDDVNQYFNCEYDYSESGFVSCFKKEQLVIEKNSYEVLLRQKGKQKTYKTGTFIVDGKLVYVNPLYYVPLNVEGTDLETIVSNGRLCVYEPDNHMYVYQYENDLYWIAEEEYDVDVDGENYMEYLAYTTQVQKLPEHRLADNRDYDSIGFVFTDNEIEDFDGGDYRVARKALPTAYSITTLQVGRFIKGIWEWTVEFRPKYDLQKNELNSINER